PGPCPTPHTACKAGSRTENAKVCCTPDRPLGPAFPRHPPPPRPHLLLQHPRRAAVARDLASPDEGIRGDVKEDPALLLSRRGAQDLLDDPALRPAADQVGELAARGLHPGDVPDVVRGVVAAER